ncbi:MAG: hypothetical protein ACI4B3_01590 [Prevotella sp.]
MRSIRKLKAKLLMFFFALLLLPQMANSQSIEQLQALIDNAGIRTRSADVVNEIEISNFNSVEYDGSLIISSGQKIRFVNGTLKSKSGYTGPIVTVKAGGYLELPSNVTIQGYEGQNTPNGLIKVTGGEVHVSGTVIKEGYSDVSTNTLIYADNSDNTDLSNKSIIYINKNSLVSGRIQLSNNSDILDLESSSINGIIAGSPDNKIIMSGDVKTYSTEVPIYFKSLTQGNNAHLLLRSALQYDICFNVPSAGISMDNVLMEGYSGASLYTITANDLAHVNYYDENYPTKEWQIFIEDNKIKVNEATKDLQSAIDALPSNGTIFEIDLSLYDTVLSKTLNINGKKVKFINGELKPNFKGNLINITNGGYLELPEGVTITTCEQTYDYEGLIYLSGGSLIVSGGQLLNYRSNYPWQEMIETNPNTTGNNYIKVDGGKVHGYINSYFGSDNVELISGYVKGVHAWNETAIFHIYGDVTDLTFASMSTSKNIIPYICSTPKNKITFQVRTESVDVDNKLAYSKVDLTAEEMKYFYFLPSTSSPWNECEWTTYLDNGYIKIKKKSLYTVSDLQAELDRIASAGTSTILNPETIEIPSEGIVIDGPLFVKSGCYAIITGGPLKIAEDYDKNTGADFVWAIQENAKITFKNITYDANSQYHHFSHFFVSGKVEMGDGFVINNVYKGTDNTFGGFFYVNSKGEVSIQSGDFDMAWTVVYAFENTSTGVAGTAILKSKGNNATINSKGTVSISGNSKVYGGTNITVIADNFVMACFPKDGEEYGIFGEGQAVQANSTTYEIGTVEGKTTLIKDGYVCYDVKFKTNDVMFEGTCRMQPTTYNMPTMILKKDAVIEISGELKQNMTPTGQYVKKTVDSYCWNEIEIGRAIIKGNWAYNMTEQDFSNLEFLNLPPGVKAYFDKRDNTVKLIDLQWLIDNPINNTDDDDEPIEVPIPCDGINTQKDISLAGLQALIDGKPEEECGEPQTIEVTSICVGCNSAPKPIVFRPWVMGGNCTIEKGSCINLTNIYVDGCSGTKHIYVEGTLIIDINVYIRNFIDYAIHVCPGGNVIWRGSGGGANGFIYNEGGTVTIEQGEIGGGSGFGIVNISGTIYIHGGEGEGETPTRIYGGIQNGTSSDNGGKIYIYGGEIFDGIINYGELIISDGTIHAKDNDSAIKNYGEMHIDGGIIDGDIYSYVDFHLCGCANVTNIYIARGVKIFITKQLTVLIRIHFIVDGDFDTNKAILLGSNEYQLTQADTQYLSFTLPNGFNWIYDTNLWAIIIISTDGIDEIFSEQGQFYDIYDMNGIKVGNTADKNNLSDGIYIINGKTIVLKNNN